MRLKLEGLMLRQDPFSTAMVSPSLTRMSLLYCKGSPHPLLLPSRHSPPPLSSSPSVLLTPSSLAFTSDPSCPVSSSRSPPSPPPRLSLLSGRLLSTGEKQKAKAQADEERKECQQPVANCAGSSILGTGEGRERESCKKLERAWRRAKRRGGGEEE